MKSFCGIEEEQEGDADGYPGEAGLADVQDSTVHLLLKDGIVSGQFVSEVDHVISKCILMRQVRRAGTWEWAAQKEEHRKTSPCRGCAW